MKIVHQFGRKVQCAGGGDLYAMPVLAKPEKFPGFSVELVAVAVGPNGEEGDALHIEGNGSGVKSMLLDLLAVVEFAEKHARERFDEIKARTVQCEVCKKWWPDGSHECKGAPQ